MGKPNNRRLSQRLIQNSSHVESLRDLRRKGFNKVQVLDRAKIEEMIQTAVEEEVDKRFASLESLQVNQLEEEKRKIQEAAQARFQELLKRHRRVVKSSSVILKQKAELEHAAEDLKGTIEDMRRELEEERARSIEKESFSMSEKGLDEMESRLETLFHELIERLKAGGSEAAHAVEGVEGRLFLLISGLLEDERERTFRRAREAQSERIGVLERRLAKLNGTLAEKEERLRLLEDENAKDPGVASVYRDIQGLSRQDVRYEKKRSLLAAIFNDNLDLRHEVAKRAQQNAPPHQPVVASQEGSAPGARTRPTIVPPRAAGARRRRP